MSGCSNRWCRGGTAAWVAVAALVLAAPGPAVAAEKGAAAGKGILHALDAALGQVIEKISPAVVQVLVSGYGPADDRGELSGAIVRQRALGSGVIVDPDGFVITNAHVVAGAQRVRILLPEGEKAKSHRLHDARVVGVEPDVDLALLKIDAKGLPALPLGRRQVRPGQLVFAVGSPEGLASTVTMGVVSSVQRQPDPARPMVYIQTDAPINPGNSGGPLVDTDGNVVGINTFILTQGGGSEGLGFAIPSDIVQYVYRSLRRFGHLHHATVGLLAHGITPGLAAALGLPQDWGVVISDVVPDSPAEKAGLAAGDVLVSVDGRPVDGMPALVPTIYLHPPDAPLTLVVRRGDRMLTLKVAAREHTHVGERLEDLGDVTKPVPKLGVVAVTLDDRIRDLLPGLREPTGVVVVARMLDLGHAGGSLEPGDVIHAVNRTKVTTVDELRRAIAALPDGGPGVLRVERHGQLDWLELDLD